MSEDRIVIIGAGVTGLAAAHSLKEKGYDPLVLDKGKSVGGRLATRSLKKGQADIGAQSFTAKNNHFVTLKNELLEDETVREWYRGLPAPHEVANIGIYPRYCGTKSMNAVAQRLAGGLEIKTESEVTAITQTDDGWLVELKNEKISAAAVILTAPVPQSLELLKKGGVELEEQLRADLEGLTYHSCITLLARFDQKSKVPAPGILHLTDDVVEWISDNQKKGISSEPVLTLQCQYRYSAENFDEKDEKLTTEILKAVESWLPGEPVETQIHRWRYSKPKTVASRPYFAIEKPSPLLFAGDAFVDGRIEGAFLSGQAAGAGLAELVQARRPETPVS